MTTTGTHLIADMHECNMGIMVHYASHIDQFVAEMSDIITRNNATLLSHACHVFDGVPGAFTAIFLLSESHVSVHTFPEQGYIAVDVYTCGNRADPAAIMAEIKTLLNSADTKMCALARGDFYSSFGGNESLGIYSSDEGYLSS
jgi:S-adenosylmethionine decarboxylase proenzyme